MFTLASRKISNNIFTSGAVVPKTLFLSNRAAVTFQPQIINDLGRFYNSFGRQERSGRNNTPRDRNSFRPRDSSAAPYERKPKNNELEELLEIFDHEAAPAQDNVDMTKYVSATVDIKGTDVPQPIEKFEDLGLHPALAHNVKRCGYTFPVPVQQYSLSIINAGRDVMSCSQTGSGKTAAYLLPILNKLLNNPIQRGRGSYSQPRAIVLAPTRELAQQVHAEVLKFTAGTRLQTAVVFGGASPIPQMKALSRGADIVVATTGRFVDFRNQGLIRVNQVQYLVLDEADRMLDIGFGPQIDDIVNDPDMSSENRQTLLFSATYPKEIQQLAKNYLKPDNIMLTVGKIGAATETITQKFIFTNEGDKTSQLQQLIVKGDLGRTLVFAKTKRRVDELFYTLKAQGAKTASIHGDHSQGQRNYALRAFLQNEVSVLVATDVAARGLDIKNIQTVINVDLPQNIDDYVHRIGRTGRAGNLGTSISMFTRDDNGLAKDMKGILEEAKQEVPDWLHELMPRISQNGGNRSYFGGNSGGYRGGRPSGNRGGSRGGFGGNRSGNRGGNRGGSRGGYSGRRDREESF